MKLLPNEIWRPVPNYENAYEISTSGKLRSIERDIRIGYKTRKISAKMIKSRINNWGYEEVKLSKNGLMTTTCIHILVAKAFILNAANKPEVNHKNGIKTDNSLQNLEWVTHAENMQHAYQYGLIKAKTKPIVNHCTGEEFKSIKEAATFYNVPYGSLKGYLNGNRKITTSLKTEIICLEHAA
jgi:hypothetical protein